MRREMVLGLAEMGADIGIFEINIKRVGRIAEEIKELGRDAIVVKVDATNKCEVDKEIEKVLKKFGTINISSLSALIVNRPQKQAHYNVSKAGVIMLTKSLAAEWVPYNIKVNTIASGHMNTELLVTVVEKGDRFGK